jgi:hypothetical protein
MPPVGFEITNSAGERPQTYALDRAATGTGVCYWVVLNTQHVVEKVRMIIPTYIQFFKTLKHKATGFKKITDYTEILVNNT